MWGPPGPPCEAPRTTWPSLICAGELFIGNEALKSIRCTQTHPCCRNCLINTTIPCFTQAESSCTPGRQDDRFLSSLAANSFSCFFSPKVATHTFFVKTSESRKACVKADKAAEGGLDSNATGQRFQGAHVILERSQRLTKPNIQHKQLVLTSVRAVNKAVVRGTRMWAAKAAPTLTFDSTELQLFRYQPEGGSYQNSTGKYGQISKWTHFSGIFSAWSSREEVNIVFWFSNHIFEQWRRGWSCSRDEACRQCWTLKTT